VESLNLLDELTAQLDQHGFYVVRDGNFDWWMGAPLLSQTAFDYESPAELTNYLGTQREDIRTLAQLAEPLVQYLETTKTAKKGPYARWQKIINDLQDYDGKKPASSIHALEDFITTGLDTVTPEHSCKGANALLERDTGADFFVDVRNKMTAMVRTRCQKITADSAYKSYTRIAQSFRDTLAGRFPFGPVDSTLPAAAPSDIIKFYQLLGDQEATARRAIGENAAYGESGDRATAFLNRMDELRVFAIPTIPDTDKQPPPFTIRFVPHFRVNTAHESGADEIIEWTLYAGGTIFRKGEPDHPGEWRTGMPVRLALRWANESTDIPAGGQPNLRVVGRNAYFEYRDPWALLTLFARHKPLAADLDATADSQPMLLRFDIRTTKDPNWNRNGANDPVSPAVVFLQIRLIAPVTGKALPEFPFSAPMLELASSIAAN
jgi:type VI secretion system protein ImpL